MGHRSDGGIVDGFSIANLGSICMASRRGNSDVHPWSETHRHQASQDPEACDFGPHRNHIAYGRLRQNSPATPFRASDIPSIIRCGVVKGWITAYPEVTGFWAEV